MRPGLQAGSVALTLLLGTPHDSFAAAPSDAEQTEQEEASEDDDSASDEDEPPQPIDVSIAPARRSTGADDGFSEITGTSEMPVSHSRATSDKSESWQNREKSNEYYISFEPVSAQPIGTVTDRLVGLGFNRWAGTQPGFAGVGVEVRYGRFTVSRWRSGRYRESTEGVYDLSVPFRFLFTEIGAEDQTLLFGASVSPYLVGKPYTWWGGSRLARGWMFGLESGLSLRYLMGDNLAVQLDTNLRLEQYCTDCFDPEASFPVRLVLGYTM